MRVFQFINHISLDVALGAVISSLFFGRIFGVAIDIPTLVLLGLVVWLIYTFDHLQDAKTIGKRAVTARHRLHQDYHQSLSFCLIIALLAIAVLIFYIPFITLLCGASLFCLVAIYFICLHFLNINIRYYKEIIIAILYTAGVLLPVLSIYDGLYSIEKLLIMAEYMCLAFTNLLIFSFLETETDRNQKFSSIVLSLGNKKSMNLLFTLVVVHLSLLLSILIFNQMSPIPIILGLMVVLLYTVAALAKHTKDNLLYRIIGDAVFLLPILYWYCEK